MMLIPVLAFVFVSAFATASTDTNIDSNNKIYLGDETKRNEYPFVVYLRNKDYPHICTGSLVDRRWVITAAHCVGYGPEIVLGDYNRPYDRPDIEPSEQVIPVLEEISHPDYDRSLLSHDIALLKLAFPANVSSEAIAKISPLDSQSYFNKMIDNKKTCKIVGWGLTQDGGTFSISSRLLEINMRFPNNSVQFVDYVWNKPGMMAVEPVYTNPCKTGNPCPGDSGAPFICRRRGKWIQTGVHSFGYTINGCVRGVKGETNVLAHLSWIESVIGK